MGNSNCVGLQWAVMLFQSSLYILATQSCCIMFVLRIPSNCSIGALVFILDCLAAPCFFLRNPTICLPFLVAYFSPNLCWTVWIKISATKIHDHRTYIQIQFLVLQHCPSLKPRSPSTGCKIASSVVPSFYWIETVAWYILFLHCVGYSLHPLTHWQV